MNNELYQIILSKISGKSPFILSIDGRCASGKSTIAADLAGKASAAVIRMDDFFLQMRQRTPERLSEPGGNLDRERFLEEVIKPLRNGVNVLHYGKFDCQKGIITETIKLSVKPLMILEGSYSSHPAFEGTADFKLFLTISAEEQKQRIIRRNGSERWADFRDRWIPKEEAFFQAFCVPQGSDLIYNTETQQTQSVF